jgi:glucose-6-phosphate 1-dehydrogenase
MAHTVVIFGTSGDLTSRKLIPALFELHREQRLPPDTRVVGLARTQFEHAQWRESLAESTRQLLGDAFCAEQWAAFAAQVHYARLDINDADNFRRLAAQLDDLEGGGSAT